MILVLDYTPQCVVVYMVRALIQPLATHLAGLALGVDLAETGPLTQLLGLRDRQQGHVLLSAQRLDELLVVGLVAVLGQHAELRANVRG